jgi:hypothetical protein
VASFDDVVRAQEERLRNGEPEHLRGLQGDHQLEYGRLLDGEVARFAPLKNLVNVRCSAARDIAETRAHRKQQTAGRYDLSKYTDSFAIMNSAINSFSLGV